MCLLYEGCWMNSTDLSSAGSGVSYSMNNDLWSTPLNTHDIVFQSLRTNIQYHKVFKDISEDEHLRQSTYDQIDLVHLWLLLCYWSCDMVHVFQVTRAPCRRTCCIRGGCLCPRAGSVSIPKSSEKTRRWNLKTARKLRFVCLWKQNGCIYLIK